MAFKKRALYSRSSAKKRDVLRQAWGRTQVGQLIDDVRQKAGSRQNVSPLSLETTLNTLLRGGRHASIEALKRSSVSDIMADAVRYAKRGSAMKSLVEQIFQALGPVGNLLSSIMRSASGVPSYRDDLKAAKSLLQGFGYEVLPPASAPQTAADLNRSLEAATEFLERNGYEVRPAGPARTPGIPADRGRPSPPPSEPEAYRPHEPGVPADRPAPETPAPSRSGPVNVDLGNGKRRKFPPDHPIVTKGRVSNFNSSNVEYFLYDVDTRTLYVRYKHEGKAGPLYGYSHVPPDLFLAMLEAPSKGTFIWDYVRIRGTVSGHNYDYRLVAVRGGYVPRKATMTANGEWYMERRVQTINRRGQRKVLRSAPMAPVSSSFTRYPGTGNGPNSTRI